MILKVGENGLLIPSEFLAGAGEFRLYHEAGRLVVEPIPAEPETPSVEGPSIFDLLGSDPVVGGLVDAAQRHDFYIYGDPHGDGSA